MYRCSVSARLLAKFEGKALSTTMNKQLNGLISQINELTELYGEESLEYINLTIKIPNKIELIDLISALLFYSLSIIDQSVINPMQINTLLYEFNKILKEDNNTLPNIIQYFKTSNQFLLKISEEIMMNYSISDIPIEDYNKCKLMVYDSIIRGYTLSPTSQKD
jgi:hypothetical protein